MDASIVQHGFLPAEDPAAKFPPGSELAQLDELGHDLPSLLEDPGFRQYARELVLPEWRETDVSESTLPQLRLYYVRVGFLASAYINQLGQPRATVLPRNLAVPLCKAGLLLERPPILSYDGYALYNWKRFDPARPITLGNIDTLQNFVHMYDEHWFILVHVEIEAIAADILKAMADAERAMKSSRGPKRDAIDRSLHQIASALQRQIAVLRRLPEKMDPEKYHRTFRAYIRFFENVVYEGVTDTAMNFRGETGAQSSVMPSLVAFMKIPHRPSALTNHLADMRRFMPARHAQAIAEIDSMPPVRDVADPRAFNDVLEGMAMFRETHYKWANEYISKWTDDPRGTGGTPYMEWLKQLIDETRNWKLKTRN
jgi:indoleamine 2,3-dioxygenase